MRALTLWQPWATLIAIGAKKIETRSWQTQQCGQWAIHASKHWNAQAKLLCRQEPFRSALEAAGYASPASIPLGTVVCVCRLVRCERITCLNVPGEPERSFGDYRPGRFAWHLEQVRRLAEPIPATGKQGPWEWIPSKGLVFVPSMQECIGALEQGVY